MGILVSTHLLTMAEQYCERFVFLHNGKIECLGNLQELRDQTKMAGASFRRGFCWGGEKLNSKAQ